MPGKQYWVRLRGAILMSDGRILELSLDAHHAPRLVDKKKLYRRYIRRHPWME